MPMTALALSFLTFVSTALGGLLALKFRDRLHHLLGFTAGVMLGVVAFDLLPEVFELSGTQGESGLKPMVALVVGFLLFHAVEKFVLVHTAHEEEYAHHAHPHVGVVSALALIGHSFLDGAGIGLAFQVSDAAGITVALAVIAHDFCDGLNTVGLMLLHRNKTSHSVLMLMLDALAPVLGAASTLAFTLPPDLLVLYLGGFAGVLLYIGVADILPQAHSQAGPGASLRLIGLTALGAALMYLVVRAAG